MIFLPFEFFNSVRNVGFQSLSPVPQKLLLSGSLQIAYEEDRE
jgi:hypothetical protein